MGGGEVELRAVMTTRGRRRASGATRGRRRASGALVALIVSAAAFAGAVAVAIADAGQPSDSVPSTAQQERGMRAGLPLKDPPVLNRSTRSGTALQLTARRGPVLVAGRRLIGDSYNGSFIGPTMRFTPGQRVRLTLVNRLPVMTNLHFHGMDISPSGSSDNPFIEVMPGKSFVYHLAVPRDHPQGTFW